MDPSHQQGGARRTCRLFWCYACHRAVRIISSPASPAVFCPRCYGQFLHEIDLPHPHHPGPLVLDFPVPHFHRHPFLPPPTLHRRSRSVSELTHLRLLDSDDTDSRLIFAPNPIPRSPPPPPPAAAAAASPQPRPRYDVPPAVNPGDYFTGAGMNELIEQLTQNDRPGHPPAPTAAIEAMPTVLITSAHLADGSQCPVCKEEFGVGEEGREMPCKHVYHSDCIVPWLRLHNSCPVCRYKLPGGDSERRSESEGGGGDDDSGWEDVRNRRPTRWNASNLLWPFRAPPSPGWEYHQRRRRDTDDLSDAGNVLGSFSLVLLVALIVSSVALPIMGFGG